MDVENQVFGKDAEAVDNNKNLESEDFIFYNQNKEEAKKNIDRSAKELTDYIDSLIQDVPDPSEEEVNAGIEKILAITHPDESPIKPVKTDKSKKVTLKVLFIAALLSILSVSCLYVVGSSHHISIENGFVSFAKETIQVVFFGEDQDEYISVDALLTDLEEHGYKDILFPQEFVANSDEYKVSLPEYLNSKIEQVTFNLYSKESTYKFVIHDYKFTQQTFDYVDADNVQTITLDDVNIYLFKFDNGCSVAEFVCDEYRYYIQTDIAYSDMVNVIKTIKRR